MSASATKMRSPKPESARRRSKATTANFCCRRRNRSLRRRRLSTRGPRRIFALGDIARDENVKYSAIFGPDERLTLVNAPGANAYPLINYEYAIVSTKQANAETAAGLRQTPPFLLDLRRTQSTRWTIIALASPSGPFGV